MIVDLCEQVARPCRNDHHVSGLELNRQAVPDLRPVVARPVELDNSPLRRGTPLPVGNVRAQDERGRSGDDVVDLADLIVFGDRVRGGLVQLLSDLILAVAIAVLLCWLQWRLAALRPRPFSGGSFGDEFHLSLGAVAIGLVPVRHVVVEHREHQQGRRLRAALVGSVGPVALVDQARDGVVARLVVETGGLARSGTPAPREDHDRQHHRGGELPGDHAAPPSSARAVRAAGACRTEK